MTGTTGGRIRGWAAVVAAGVVAAFGLSGAGRDGERVRAAAESAERMRVSVRQRPLVFEANRGQADPRVRFLSRGAGYTFYLTPTESVVALAAFPESARGHSAEPPGEVPAALLRMRLVGANPSPRVRKQGRLTGYSSYFIGSDASQWRTGIPSYEAVRYTGVYPGVDLVYYGNQDELEHDFILQPGVRPETIQLEYGGTQDITIDAAGELLLHTPGGVVRQKKPFSYQEIAGARKEVPSRYVMLADNRVGFQVEGYDPSRRLVIDPVLRYSTFIGGSTDDYAMAMAQDSDSNVYVTGYTGSFQQTANGEANRTPASNLNGFPLVNQMMGDPDLNPSGGPALFDFNPAENPNIFTMFNCSRYDAFVTVLNNQGTQLQYSTYYGGNQDDYGLGIAVDSARSIYVTGMTRSGDLPLKVALQPFNGLQDGFVVKINTSNAGFNQIVYSTYLGGSGNDRGRAIAVDGTGNAHIAGTTDSLNFTVTPGAFQPFLAGGNDLFVVSLDASGSAFNYSTYFGGTGNEDGMPFSAAVEFNATTGNNLDYAVARSPFINARTTAFANCNSLPMGPDLTVALTVDNQGNTYVGGGTNSADFFVTPGALQPTLGGQTDGFLTKFTPQGSVLYSTYLGGGGDDACRSIAIDNLGNAHVTGYTASADFPTRAPAASPAPAFQSSFAGGNTDAFVTKVDPNGRNLIYSTYLGGSGDDIGNGIAVSSGGQAYVTGTTSSLFPTFPLVFPFQNRLFGVSDMFVTKYRPDGSDFEYSTYFGGGAFERGMALTVNSNGQAHVAGTTGSFNLPTSLAAFQRGQGIFVPGTDTYNQNPNGYPIADVFVIQPHAPPFAADSLIVTDIQLMQVSLAWRDNSDNEDGFEIERKRGDATSANPFAVVGSVPTDQVIFTNTGLIPTTTYTYRVRPFNRAVVGGVNTTFYGPYSNQLTVTTLPQAPAAPSGLRVTPIDRTRLRLDWTDNSNNESGFRIERAPESAPGSGTPGGFNEIALTGEDISTYTDTELTSNTCYFYRIFATNAGGDSAPDGPVKGQTLPDPPSQAPTALSALAVASNQVDLSWSYPTTLSDPEGFKIERSEDGGLNFRLIRITQKQAGMPAGTTFSDTTVSVERTYTYRVAAYNLSGDGPFSANDDAIVMAAPSNMAGLIVSATQADISWRDNSNLESGFRVERSDNGGPFNPLPAAVGASSGIGGTVMFSDTTILPDITYAYRVRALSSLSDVSSPSNSVTVLALPAVPANVQATAVSSAQVDVTWTDSSTSETGFKVFRAPETTPGSGAPGAFAQIGANLPADSTSFTDTTVATETVYFYRVVAFNSSGDSPASAHDEAVVLAAPSNIAAVSTSTDVTLTFTDNSLLEDNYKIERSRNAGAFLQLDTVPGNNGTVTYVDSTIQIDSVYVYRVRGCRVDVAVVDVDFSSPDATGSIATPPAAPSAVTVNARSSSLVEITFQDNSTTETNFRIERSVAGGPFVALAPLAGPSAGSGLTVTYFDGNPTQEAVNTYRVIALNGAIESLPSGSAGVTVLAGPDSLVVTVPPPPAGINELVISWQDRSNFETGFTIERSPDGTAGSFVQLPVAIAAAPGVGTTVSFTDTMLAQNTAYFYRVRAAAANSFSDYSNTGNGTTLPVPPAAPDNLTATTLSASAIRLAWNDNSNNEDGFRVFRATETAPGSGTPGAFTQLGADLAANTTSLTDASVVADTFYFYRVQAFNRGGSSAFSNTATAATPPLAPDSLTAALTQASQVTLNWRDRSLSESGFKIERSADGGPFTLLTTVPAAAGTGSLVVHLDNSVLPDTTYTYRVRATNIGGDSAASNEATAGTPPGAPSQLALSGITHNEIRLFWIDNSRKETQFKIERSTAGGMFVEIVTVPGSSPASQTGGQITYLDTNLSGNTPYAYRVRATTSGVPFDSGYSNTANGVTLPNPPAAPLNLVATATSQTSIDLVFVDNSVNEANFRVERAGETFPGSGVAGTFLEIAGNVGPRNGTGSAVMFTDSTLVAATRYFYRVRATNAGGDSPYSNVADDTTFPLRPSAASGVTVAPVSDTSLRVTWSDTSNNEDTFFVERSLDGISFVTAATLGANTTTFTDTGLAANTRYRYRVRASNRGGFSDFSNTGSGLTLPAAITNLTARALGSGEILLEWSQPNGADGFKIEERTGTLPFREIVSVGSASRQFTRGGLIPNAVFTFRIRGFNQSGDAANSNEATATVLPAIQSVTLSRTSVKGGKPVTVTVRLTGAAPAGGATVAVSSSDPAVKTTPDTLTIPAGANSASFTARTKKVRRNTQVTITATLNGSSRSATLTVRK